jgi:hypothetical protein
LARLALEPPLRGALPFLDEPLRLRALVWLRLRWAVLFELLLLGRERVLFVPELVVAISPPVCGLTGPSRAHTPAKRRVKPR